MISKIFAQLYSIITYVISPPQCYSCKAYTQTRVVLCIACQNNLEFIAPKMFTINDRYILTVYALTRYTEPLRPMIFAKYRSDPAMLEKLAHLVWQHSVLPNVYIDALIPIPLHWTRNLKRGFNQAEILAQLLSKLSNIPVICTLKRIKQTQYQVRVEHVDRRCNVKNAFELNTINVDLTNKHIMLVDDSCTTGSTAIEAAKILTKLNPASITMIVICRAL